MQPTIHFDTSEFVRSHGKQPRGYGHWGFHVQGDPDEVVYWVSGTLTHAKQQIITGLRFRFGFQDDAHRYLVVTVCP